ncbi:hypothetical protein Tco_0472823 [Tanacetum coccineum]
MADLVFPDHVHASLDHAPLSSQQDIVMTDAATETTTPEVVALHVLRLRFRVQTRSEDSQAKSAVRLRLYRIESLLGL